MKINIRKILFRTLAGIGILLGLIVVLLEVLPMLFPGALNKKVNEWANANINGHVYFSRTSLHFFKHFPSVTFTIHDMVLFGCAPFEKDTLIAAGGVSFGIDMQSLLHGHILISRFYLDQAFINIQADTAGHANYYVYKSSGPSAPADTSGGGASLGISGISIRNSRLVYNDQSLPMTIIFKGFNYVGSGDMSKDVFDLKSHTSIQSADFYYAKQPFVLGKVVDADLVTQINTKSLSFIFEKNDLNINQLPVQFNGSFSFIKNGYDMDFNVVSKDSDLNEIVTALPPDYQKMLSETKIRGTGQMQLGLKGRYIAADTIAPDLTFSMQIRDGYIANKKSPTPLQHLFLNLETIVPGLNPDSLTVNLDSLHFNVGDGYFNSSIYIKGLSVPDVHARVNAELDLHKWDSALGLKAFHVRGHYFLHLLADGKFERKVLPAGRLRKKMDTVITSIPKFELRSYFRDGYIKYASVPEPVSNISFNLEAGCADSNYKHITMSVDSLNVTALNDYVKGYFRLKNLTDFFVDADLKAQLHLDDIRKYYPIDSLDLGGVLNADIHATGNYLPAKKKYPAVNAAITMNEGYVKTKYYPHPIEHITVDTKITDSNGALSGVRVVVNPISFTFEDEPFTVKARLSNFNNVAYKVHMKGKLNVGAIYQVFARKGYGLNGMIDADMRLSGTQADAVAGRYDLLDNSGTLTMDSIRFTTDMYPKPFIISRGEFSFHQDKMQFDTFALSYGRSLIFLDGSLSNVINYVVKPGSVLTGSFNLTSNYVNLTHFLAGDTTTTTAAAAASSAPAPPAPASAGVFMVPRNLNLDITADIKSIKYPGLMIKDASGDLNINNGTITLKQFQFNMVDAIITMDASYTGIDPQHAVFDYHITADSFDIRKAYNGIKLFHDMASAASSVQGLISLDYKLSGALNGGMQPVYPSLKGGGVISAQRLSMHGFKLFNAIGKKAAREEMNGEGDMSKVQIKSTIDNCILNIERTVIKTAGFHARFEGQVGLVDKALNLRFRLGLPPLGLVGIPMSITGTQDKPDIRMGKGAITDTLKDVTEEN